MKITPFLCVFLSSMLAVAPLPGQTAGALAGTPTLLPPPAAVGLAQVRVIENDGDQTPAGSQSTKGITIEVSDATGAAVADAAVTIRLPDTEPTGTFADGTHSAVGYTNASGRAEINGIRWGLSPGSVSMRITATKGTSHAGVLLEKSLTRPVSAAVAPVLPAYTAAVSNTTDMLQAIPPPSAPAFKLPIAKSGASGSMLEPGKPAHPQLPNATTAQTQPASVSITTTGATGYHPHHSNKKWVIAAVVVAAGAGGAFAAMHGKGGTPAATVAPLSIGTPSISIGPPH